MEMKVMDAIISLAALNQIGSIPKVKGSYIVGRNIAALQEIQTLYNEKRNERLAEMGTPKEDKPGHYDLGDNAEIFNEADKAALDETVPVDLKTVSLEDLDGADIDPKIFAALGWLIED